MNQILPLLIATKSLALINKSRKELKKLSTQVVVVWNLTLYLLCAYGCCEHLKPVCYCCSSSLIFSSGELEDDLLVPVGITDDE